MSNHFAGRQKVLALTVTELRQQLSTARTFVMYAHTAKLRGEALEAVTLIRSELLRRGEPA